MTKQKVNSEKNGVKTRMAPSPTGMLHIGGLRTALYNYLFAQQNKGEFILRIEDTDQERFVKGATEKVEEMLKWAGLNWDGQPVTQSERVEIYKKYAEKLVEQGKAYYCFCTPEELKQMRDEQAKKKQPPRYDGTCRNLVKDEVKERLQADEVEKKLEAGEKYVIRLKVPENQTVEFNDTVYGKIKVNTNEIDDQVLIKSDGFPTYHLAVVVDDHEMGITHVMRGEEWLPSTPKHILLYQAFGWDIPEFIHLPNILGENKKKLSKRENDVSVEDFKKQGYLPEALINYLALLGWNPGTEQEIFSLAELVKKFDIKKIHKAGAIFDVQKLNNINGQYIRRLSVNQLTSLCEPYLQDEAGKYKKDYIKKVVAVEQERLKKLSDITENAKLFFTEKLDYKTKLLVWKKSGLTETKERLIETKKLMETVEFNKDDLEKKIFDFIAEKKYNNGEVLWPLRVALSGQQNSPSPFEIADVLGKEKTISRVEDAIKKL